MTWFTIALTIAIGIAAVGAIAAFIGSRLPQSHRASGERVFPVPPDMLWQTLTDIEAFPSWRTDVKRVQRLQDGDAKLLWVEEGRHGRMTYAFERLEPPRVLVSRIADPNLPFGGTWTYDIGAVPGGSRLTITEDGEIYNPLFRFMARYVFGYNRTLKGYLSALEARFHGV